MWGGGELSYLILTIFASQSWEEGGGAPFLGGGGDVSFCFGAYLCVCVYLQCSGLIEMGVVVVKWSEFCYVGYVRHSCIKNVNRIFFVN